ncbi:MFS transporter [Paenibacillus flagellatus]|uniref:MFS transporter n=2 Tax=Paenibacillus flagellatus TaxID=2211139 RepID=A0A2V5KI07_9BACL|nr:MFS transporter [Paenibacillus flagellatus]
MKIVESLANATMFTTYAIYYVAELRLSPFELLLVGTALEATVLLFEGITGVVADTYGRRLSVLSGVFALGAGFVLQGLVPWLDSPAPAVPALAWILVSQVVCGIGYTLISGAETAWIVDEAGEADVGRLFMRVKRLSLIATLAGIALSVGLSTVAPNVPYVVGGLLYAGLGFFLVARMTETNFVPAERVAGASPFRDMKTTWLTGVNAVRHRPVLIAIVVVTLFGGAASEGYDRLWEAHMIGGIGFPDGVPLSMAAWFGVISVLVTVLSLIAVRIAERRLDMDNTRHIVTSMFVLTGLRIAAIASFALSPGFAWAFGSVLALGVIRSLSGPIYDTWLNQNIESKVRATVLSMMGQSDALGQTAGGPLVGLVGSRYSVRASLLAAAALLSPLLIVFGRVLRKRK